MPKKVIVASKNPAKISAVEEILKEYPHLRDAEVISVEPVPSHTDQPRSLEETIDGAENRAIGAFKECDYAIGIESGLMKVPKTKSGYMDVCACVIYDGKSTHLGLSSAWEFPDPRVMKLITDEGMNMSDATKKAGMTTSEYVGWGEGAIGIVTKGRMNRTAFTKQALRTALIHLDP
ncbi:MAG: inosine/xanthosine triphosphatase [Minisyncoccia bacterium]